MAVHVWIRHRSGCAPRVDQRRHGQAREGSMERCVQLLLGVPADPARSRRPVRGRGLERRREAGLCARHEVRVPRVPLERSRHADALRRAARQLGPPGPRARGLRSGRKPRPRQLRGRIVLHLPLRLGEQESRSHRRLQRDLREPRPPDRGRPDGRRHSGSPAGRMSRVSRTGGIDPGAVRLPGRPGIGRLRLPPRRRGTSTATATSTSSRSASSRESRGTTGSFGERGPTRSFPKSSAPAVRREGSWISTGTAISTGPAAAAAGRTIRR